MTLRGIIKGKEHRFEVPLDMSEITFSELLDFQKAELLYFKCNETGEGDPAEAMTKCVSCIVKGPVERLPFAYPGDGDIQGYRFNPLSVMRLYSHIVYLIREFSDLEAPSKSLRVEYKGESYYLEPHIARRFTGAKMYETGEVVEIEESDRLLTTEIEENGDPDGIIEFERERRAMAVLLRKNGELLPADVRERKAFIEERSIHFADLPADVVLKVRFFLRSILNDSLIRATINHISGAVRKSISPPPPKKEKRRRKQKAAPKKSQPSSGGK